MQKRSWRVIQALFLVLAQVLYYSDTAQAEQQSYKVKFVHTVRNLSTAPVENVIVNVAIPASCKTQQLKDLRSECNIGVAPSVVTDHYGQSVYSFNLGRIEVGQSISVGYSCCADFYDVLPIDLSKFGTTKIPEEILKVYTGDNPRIYDLKNPALSSLATQFISRYPRAEERVRAIHYYVASNIKYDREGKWDSAPQVLARRTGSCSEISYLFCALCRATGIPTRFVGGSRMRRAAPYEDPVGHRWSEVYFAGLGWVPFDPTLDAKDPKQLKYFTCFFQPSLITFHGGGSSSLLANAYNSNCSQRDKLDSQRVFYWR
ncbi:transglutaminase domain-containing protein [bacterium]|nr:transglutaminase domain-containing protein [bacterium]